MRDKPLLLELAFQQLVKKLGRYGWREYLWDRFGV